MNKSKSLIPIGFVLLVSAVMLFFNTQLKFNYDFEDFFQEDDANVQYYQQFRQKFEDDSRFLLIGIKNAPTVFDSTFLADVDNLYLQLKSDSSVQEIYSPTRLKNPIISRMAGIYQTPVMHIDAPEKYATDSAFIFSSPQLMENFFSEDGQSLVINLKVREGISRTQLQELFAKIRNICTESYFNEYHIAGKLIAEETYIQKTQTELLTFASVSLVLIVFFLYITYRSFWLLVIPLFVVGLAVLWSTGAMSATGKDLDLLMSLLPSIMFVVGMSDVIHFFSKYIEELRKGLTKSEAIRTTINEVGKATFLTSVTTAIGFFTLYFIDIKPIREFGLYCGLGVLFAFIITILLLPPLLNYLPKPSLFSVSKSDRFWNRILLKSLQTVFVRRKAILVGFLAISVLAIGGISQIQINTKLIDDLRDDDPMKIDFVFFEENFSGARPFELALTLPHSKSSFFEDSVLHELGKLDHFLHETYGVKSLMGPATMAKGLNQALNGGMPEYFQIPENKRDLKQTQRYLHKGRNRDEYKLFINDSLHIGRISGKIPDWGSQIIQWKNIALQDFIDQELDPNQLQVRITGSALLIDENNEDLASNMILGLVIAFGIIALIMGGLFRSLKMIFIALMPNVIPLCILGGILGFGHIDLKLSTSIIFTVAFGIAVDDTIHFMSRYRMERNLGKSPLYAIKRSFISTGKALIITSFILSSGFMSLMLSSFMGTFYTGLFISLTLFFALISDLTLLPVLLLYFEKSEGRVRMKG